MTERHFCAPLCEICEVFEFQLEPFLQDRMVMGSEFWIGLSLLQIASPRFPDRMQCIRTRSHAMFTCYPGTETQVLDAAGQAIAFKSFSVLGGGVHTCTPW